MLAPLLVTLAMDDASFQHFDAERVRHFPPARNKLPAHITLFHQLPGEEAASVRATLAELAQVSSIYPMRTSGMWLIGFGVAYRIDSAETQQLHATLQARFLPWLTRQDAQRGFKPHITVQNKASAEQAKALHAELSAVFAPRTIQAVGFDLWHYLGGPWQHLERFPFAPS